MKLYKTYKPGDTFTFVSGGDVEEVGEKRMIIRQESSYDVYKYNTIDPVSGIVSGTWKNSVEELLTTFPYFNSIKEELIEKQKEESRELNVYSVVHYEKGFATVTIVAAPNVDVAKQMVNDMYYKHDHLHCYINRSHIKHNDKPTILDNIVIDR